MQHPSELPHHCFFWHSQASKRRHIRKRELTIFGVSALDHHSGITRFRFASALMAEGSLAGFASLEELLEVGC